MSNAALPVEKQFKEEAWARNDNEHLFYLRSPRKEDEAMTKMCPVCEVKQEGLCVHEKMMLGMMGIVVAVVLILVFVVF